MSRMKPEISIQAPWLQPLELRVRVASITELAPHVKKFTLVTATGQQLPPFTAGSHVSVKVTQDDEVKLKPYSLTGNPKATQGYQIVVSKGATLGGVSSFLHECATVGMELEISAPTGGMDLTPEAAKHVFVAGGMGITPFLSQLSQLSGSDSEYELHYTFPTTAQGIFLNGLTQTLPAKNLFSYASRESGRLELMQLVAAQPPATHFYVSGPRSLVEGVIAAAQALGLPPCHIHFERSMEIAPALNHYLETWRKFELVVG